MNQHFHFKSNFITIRIDNQFINKTPPHLHPLYSTSYSNHEFATASVCGVYVFLLNFCFPL